MKRKFIIILMCIIGTVTISYKFINENLKFILNAQSAPTFQLPKGAKVVLGKYNNKEIVWDIGNNNNNGSYVLMSSKPIVDKIQTYNSSLPFTTNTVPAAADRDNYCVHDQNSTRTIAVFCPTTGLKNEINKITLTALENSILQKQPYLPHFNDIKENGSLGLRISDRAYKSGVAYWLDGYLSNSGTRNYYFSSLQNPQNASALPSTTHDFDAPSISFPSSEKIITANCTNGIGDAYARKEALRPYSLLNKSNVVFAANTSYADGAWHNYVIDTVNLNGNNELNPNKLRVQSSLTASLQDIKKNNISIQKVAKNQNVSLSVNANTGSNTKISVILYNDAGTDIQYYKMMDSTISGTNDYMLDLTGIAAGEYQVAVINEEYDASSNLPVESSAISDLMPLEIVEPHKLTYTKTPQSGATRGDYEFSKNVNAGQTVGKITVNPQGVMPLTYTVDSNGDNTYQNFEVDGLSDGTSGSTSLNVKIKGSAPDLVNGGLKAGTYKFCVSAVDANGDPVDTSGNPTEKVCTSFTIEKTNPTIAFDDPSTTKKSIADAATAWNETATATPSTGTKITYSITGGDVSLISINPDTVALIFTLPNALLPV